MLSLLGQPSVSYCEKTLPGFVKRPWYLLSNVAFLIVGFLILQKGKWDKLSKLFGFAIIIVGIISGVYDVTFTRWSQILDLAGMFLLATVILYLNLDKLYPQKPKMVWASLVGAFLVSFGIMVLFGGLSGDLIFGLYIVGICVSEYYLYKKGIHKNFKPWVFAIAFLALGFVFWVLDVSKSSCFSVGFFNGRAVFHYLTATAVYFIYTFYASQTESNKLK